jgi:amidohydrolase
MTMFLSAFAFLVAIQPAADKPREVKCAYRAELASAIQQAVAASQADLITYYKDLHVNPELSLHETQTARKIAERLTALGYKVAMGVGGTGVVGILENGSGPTLLIRGDMDALPIAEETGLPYASKVRFKRDDGSEVGVMHACGHDMHQTVLLGTSRLLVEFRDQWRGKVMIVAQPAEEIGSGARAMIKDGLFERFGKPDYCIALHVSSSHPAGVVAYTSGWALANVDSFDITIYGRGGHGSRPHEAVDPIVMAAHVVTALQTVVSRRINPQEPSVITVGSIHAGSKHNIIPDTAKLEITVRSYTDEVRKTLLDGIRQVTLNTCRALGAEKDPDVHLREGEFTPATFNDPALSEAAGDVFRKAIGPDRVLLHEPIMGGEDFSEYFRATKAPSFMFWLGSVPKERYDASRREGGPPLPSIHSSKYYPDPEPTAETGVQCMTSLALSLLAGP